MFSFVSKALDRLVIRLATAAQPKPGTFQFHCDEAARLLQSPDFLLRPVVAPDDVRWTSENDFEFSSAGTNFWPETKTVHAKLFRATENWQQQPTVVMIHGWNDELGYHFRQPFQARRLVKRGVNVAMLELPYHLQRRPRTAGAVNDFLTENLLATMSAAQQAIGDIRALLAWLEAQGCRRIGLLGVSLGGWLAGLVSCLDNRVKFALLNVPAARMDRVVKELSFTEPLRRALKIAEKSGEFSLEKLNLRSHQTMLSPENILIIEAVDDLFVFPDAAEELWLAWNKPEIWRVKHAHISGLFAPGLLNREVDWLAGKAFEKI